MTILLGPCPCQGCGQLLWWARAHNGKGLCWRNRDGTEHDCE